VRQQTLSLSLALHMRDSYRRVAHMQLRIAPAALFLAASIIPAIAQQQSTSGITLRGRVGAATLIAPSENNPIRIQGDASAQLMAVDKSNIIVRLTGTSASRNSRVSVRLLIRTNTGFELRATTSGSGEAPAITASVASIHSTGAGVLPSAASAIRSAPSAVELSSEPAGLAGGPRISKGPASSLRNAVQIELLLEVGPHLPDGWSKDVLVTIAPDAAF
jgi:hypothetical protein